jgi:hypothetical protein
MVSPRTTQRLLLAGALLAGFAVRVASFRSPLLDHHSWRQADTASIARNYYRERFNLFYPQVDERGAQPTGYVETGLEAPAFAVAALSKLVGFHHETGRLLATLCFLGSAALLFRFLRDRYGARTAVVGAGVYAFAFPLQLYMERAFMNEAALVCLTFASYRLTQRHLATGSRRALLGLGASTTLIAMVKAPYLIAWAGILGLYAEKLGARTMRRAELGAIGLANLGAVYLWYSHARALGAQTGLSFDMTDKLYSSSVVFTTLFLRRVEGQIRQDVLGLPAVLLLLVGLAVAWREGRRFEVAALAGFAGYVVILARGCMVHDYYLLAVVPAAAVLVPVGLCALAARIGRGDEDRAAVATSALVGLLVVYSLFRSIGPHSWYDIPVDKAQLCQAGPGFLGAGDRLAVVGSLNPELLYCLDRRGFLFEPGAEPRRLADAWRLGATVFVLSHASTGERAVEWVRRHGRTAFANASYEVVRLRPAPTATR